MDAYVQRYPKDNRYDGTPSIDYRSTRFFLWKWVASFLFTAAIMLPILGTAAQLVYERESKMKDLLQISGLLDTAYWASFELAGIILSFIIIVICVLLLTAGRVLSSYHIGPYIVLMVMYAMALMSFLMAFGFVVFKSEYYGLPAFLVMVSLCVAGDYVANDFDLPSGLKRK